MDIQDVYRTLQQLGLVRSQIEFSRLWLGKSARYYSSILARQQQPSLGTLTTLQFRLRNTLAHINDPGAESAIFSSLNRLDKHVILRTIVGRPSR